MNCYTNIDKKPIIVQCVKKVGLGTGIESVAYFLDQEFKKVGYSCERVMLKRFDKKSKNSYILKLYGILNIFVYSILGTLKIRKMYKNRKNCIILCHDAILYGDIYINHWLHKAWLNKTRNKYKKLLFNPQHVSSLFIDWIRYRFNVHSYIVSFCENNKEILISLYRSVNENNIYLIPLGVDSDKFYPSYDIRINKRLELGIKKDGFVILFVGHEFGRKGLDYLIESLHFLPKNVVLEIVSGNEFLIDKYSNIAKKHGVFSRVNFRGVVDDLCSFYNAADIFVLPTEYETWGLVGLEAIACGLPILMPNIGCIASYLREGEDGYFITQDPKDIAEKVQYLMQNPELCLELSKNAREIALEYNWENIAKQYLQLIHKVWEERIQMFKTNLNINPTEVFFEK